MEMGLNRALLYFIGCSVISLNIFQANCSPTAPDVKNGEKSETELGDLISDRTKRVVEILTLANTILEKNKNLLLQKKEIKELLGEELEILETFEELDSELKSFAGGEIAIRYYLKIFPKHEPLLDLAVEIWRKIISDSSKQVKKSSTEIYESFKAKSTGHIDVYTEIAIEVMNTADYKLVTTYEYNYFFKAVFVKLNTVYEIMMNSELERQLFKKISTFYKQGIFDDICESLGDQDVNFLFEFRAAKTIE